MSEQIIWDDHAPKSPQEIVWDDENAANRDKARELVRKGQADYFPNMATASGKAFKHGIMELMHTLGYVVPPGASELLTGKRRVITDDDLRKARDEANAAGAAPGGKFGQVVGETGAAVPIGGPQEMAVVKGAEMLKSPLAQTIAKIAGRTGEGAATSAIMAGPDNREEAAKTGAVFGGTLATLQAGLRRGATGIVPKSDDLKALETDIALGNQIPGAPQRELFVPISQGAAEGSVSRRIFKSALPYAPGVEGQLMGQSKAARDVVDEALMQYGAPEGRIIPIGANKNGMTPQRNIADIKGDYDKIYQGLKDHEIPAPGNFEAALRGKINLLDPKGTLAQSDVNDYVSKIVAEYEKHVKDVGDSVTGSQRKINAFNVKSLKDYAEELNGDLPMKAREVFTGATKGLSDNILLNEAKKTSTSPAAREAFQTYLAHAPHYSSFRALKAASDRNIPKKGRFDYADVANEAPASGDLQGMAQNAHAVLDEPAVQLNQTGRVMTYPLIAAAARLGGYGATALTLGGTNALASKVGQKALYGDTRVQQAIADLLRTNPDMLRQVLAAGRNEATISGSD